MVVIQNEKIRAAIEVALNHAQKGGSEHKLWVIDQMLRALLSKEEYMAIIGIYEEPPFKWHTGKFLGV